MAEFAALGEYVEALELELLHVVFVQAVGAVVKLGVVILV